MALAEAEGASEPPGNPAQLRDRGDTLRASIQTETNRRPLLEAALLQVRALTERVRATSDREPLSPDDIASVMQELGKVATTNSQGEPVALTVQRGQDYLWVSEFERRRFDLARHAYSADPESLPPAVRAHFETIWQDVVAHEMAGMGHAPFGYVEFDFDSDVTLLELPSSDLIGWMFGDVDNLVLTIKKTDLAVGRFDDLKVQCSN